MLRNFRNRAIGAFILAATSLTALGKVSIYCVDERAHEQEKFTRDLVGSFMSGSTFRVQPVTSLPKQPEPQDRRSMSKWLASSKRAYATSASIQEACKASLEALEAQGTPTDYSVRLLRGYYQGCAGNLTVPTEKDTVLAPQNLITGYGEFVQKAVPVNVLGFTRIVLEIMHL